jgi:hypothetical protein
MFQQILYLTGIDKKLEALKNDLEAKANDSVALVKGIAIQVAVAAALAVAAAICGVLAIGAGLIAMFVWLQPIYGTLAAVGIVTGVIALVTLILVFSAIKVAKKKTKREIRLPDLPSRPAVAIAEPVAPARSATASYGASGATESLRVPRYAASPTDTSETLDAVFAMARKFAKLPRTGLEPVDEFISVMEPRAAAATKEMAGRAATLIQTGDRTTMVAIVGAAAAVGWLLVKAAPKSSN